MKNGFSEFSYGYALTEDYVRNLSAPLIAAPVLPSLIEEADEGWDLKLSTPGIPILLQFKLSDYMKYRSAGQFATFNRPYYRFKLWPPKRSKQHEHLVKLDNGANNVHYVAPGFHLTSELNSAYLTQEVVKQSIFVRPSFVGNLPDDKQHFVAFARNQGGQWDKYFCSDAVEIREPTDWETVTRELAARLVGEVKPPLLADELRRMLVDMRKALGPRQTQLALGPRTIADSNKDEEISDLSVLHQVAQLSALTFQCVLLVVTVSQGDGPP